MDFLIEIILEVYLELMLCIVPEKAESRRFVIMMKLFAVLVLLAVLALFIWGIALVVDNRNMLGVIPIVIASVISLFQIVAGIILVIKREGRA